MRVLRSEDKKQHDSPHTYREAIPQGGDAADGEQRVVGGLEGGELHFCRDWCDILFGLGMGGGIGTGESHVVTTEIG